MRDITLGDTIYIGFTTRQFSDGVPTVLAGTPVLSTLEENNATPITAGVSVSVDRATVVGLNEATIVATSGNGYEAGKGYSLYISTGTVGGVSVVGEVVGQFTIAASAAAVDLANGTDGLTALKTGIDDIPTVSEFNARTLVAASYFDPTADAVANVTLVATTTAVTNQVTADTTAISGDSTAADNLEATYDGTGYTNDEAPAKQSQVSSLANVGSAVHKPAASYVLTTGTQSANTVSATEALDSTRHEHTDTAGVMELYYEFLIGSGTPSSTQVTGYITGNNDDLDVYGYDWVSASFKQIGNIQGTNSTVNAVHSFDLFVDMVGSGADEGKVRVRFFKASGLTTALLAIDQIFVAFSQGAEGYDNGAVWADSTRANTNTEVGIDGVARNTVSTVGATNTLLASTNLHRVEIAPGSSFTFAASQTDELWQGRDWTLALGGQDITGSFIFGAEVSGVATATGEYEFEECDLGAVTLDNDGHFEVCGLTGTFTVGQAGTFTFHQCFTEASGGIVLDFAAVGATTINLYSFDGGIIPTNMAAGDLLHITGAGTIVTATCTGGTIEHDGFFEYTDAGGNVTEQQSDIKVDVDAILVDSNELQTDWTNTGRLDNILDARMAEASINTTGGAVDTVTSVTNQVTADVTGISGDSTAADNLEASMETIVASTATGTPTTTTMADSSLTEATNGHYIGRIIIWRTGALAEQATSITAYDGSTKTFTFDATTNAASAGDAYVVL